MRKETLFLTSPSSGGRHRPIETAEDFGRKDWFNQAVGAVMNIAITLSFSKPVVDLAWQCLPNAVSGIYQLTPVIVDGVKQLTQ